MRRGTSSRTVTVHRLGEISKVQVGSHAGSDSQRRRNGNGKAGEEMELIDEGVVRQCAEAFAQRPADHVGGFCQNPTDA